MVEKIKVGYTNNHITAITNNKEQVIHRGTVRLKTQAEKEAIAKELQKQKLTLKDGVIKKGQKVVTPNNGFIVTELKGKNGKALYLSGEELYVYSFEIIGEVEKDKPPKK